MAEVGIPGEEDSWDVSQYRLYTIEDLSPDDFTRLRGRIEEFTRLGKIKPNAFDPLDRNRILRWPEPVPRETAIK